MLDEETQKEMVANGVFNEKAVKELAESQAEAITELFTSLANITPLFALDVLKQMNEQFNEELADEINESHQEYKQPIIDSME